MRKIATTIIGILMVITLMGCGENNTNCIPHTGEYSTYVNLFDTLNYLNYKNDPTGYIFTDDDIYKVNLKYEDNTLWLWNNKGKIDIHRYDNVAYKEFNVIDDINGLKIVEMTLRVYYYKDTKIIILKTSFNKKLIENFDFGFEDNAFYDKLNETLNEYEKKIEKYIIK